MADNRPVAVKDNYTLSHDNGVKGWTSFYSYLPDYMIGMNNYFYTFNGGNIYRHNTNEVRNNYYGVQYSSQIISVFNDEPLQNKLFKTLNIEGDDSWAATVTSDIQDSGFVQSSWFERKEQSYYAFIRNSGTTPASIGEYALRSLNGISDSISNLTTGNSTTYVFSPSTIIGSIVSVGDSIYYGQRNGDDVINITWGGNITDINVNPLQGANNIVVDVVAGATAPTSATNFIFFIKNAVAESHGILGHYAVFTITNGNTNAINLFALESEVMKSYP